MIYQNYHRLKRWFQNPFDVSLHRPKPLSSPQRLNAVLRCLLYYETKGSQNASLTYRHFNISLKTFHQWRHRFDPKNLRTLESRSKAPKKTQSKPITQTQESRIIDLRKGHIRWGKMKLKTVYEQRYGQPISSWKIQYTIQTYGLYYNRGGVGL
jgi:transposase